MEELSYRDFDLLIESGLSAGSYRARVVSAPSGPTAAVEITLPFSDLELEVFLLKIGRPRRQPVRGLGSTEDQAIRRFGGALFEAVFYDELRVALATSLSEAEHENTGLRLRLRLSDVPEIADLPWEYLFDTVHARYPALSEWTPLVRYLDIPGTVRQVTVEPPLSVLVLIASPSDFPALDVEAEWGKLRDALAGLERADQVRLTRVSAGTLPALQRELRQAQHHVFHYIGHGGYDEANEDGLLAFEGRQGRAQLVGAQHIGMLLHNHRSLRLAVLNSCEGARGGRRDPYSGTAQSLVRQGIPAVVAMQFEITDEAAIVFSQNMYEAVADGFPLDAAVAEGRKAIYNESNAVEWATPVLYLRAPDGRIFDIARARRAAEDEQRRKRAAEDEQRREQAAEDEQRRKQAAEDEQRREQAAEDEQRRERAAEDEQRREQAAEDEQRRKQARRRALALAGARIFTVLATVAALLAFALINLTSRQGSAQGGLKNFQWYAVVLPLLLLIAMVLLLLARSVPLACGLLLAVALFSWSFWLELDLMLLHGYSVEAGWWGQLGRAAFTALAFAAAVLAVLPPLQRPWRRRTRAAAAASVGLMLAAAALGAYRFELLSGTRDPIVSAVGSAVRAAPIVVLAVLVLFDAGPAAATAMRAAAVALLGYESLFLGTDDRYPVAGRAVFAGLALLSVGAVLRATACRPGPETDADGTRPLRPRRRR